MSWLIFRWPEAKDVRSVSMRPEELAMLINGMDLARGLKNAARDATASLRRRCSTRSFSCASRTVFRQHRLKHAWDNVSPIAGDDARLRSMDYSCCVLLRQTDLLAEGFHARII